LRLYLIRHGETEYNKNKIIQGHTEVPLNDTGIAQATRLAERMKRVTIDLIYASDLRRAAMTAAILASHTGVPLVYEPGFRERNPGALCHRSYEEAAAFFGDPLYHPPEGESVPEFERRTNEAFERLARVEGGNGRHIAVVSHGMVCACFLRNQLRVAPEEQGRHRWRNTSVTIADYVRVHAGGRWELVTLGDASHLEDEDAAEPQASATGA
jgi:broad specificity phosphatase PhoE